MFNIFTALILCDATIFGLLTFICFLAFSLEMVLENNEFSDWCVESVIPFLARVLVILLGITAVLGLITLI